MKVIYYLFPCLLLSQTITIYKDDFALVKKPLQWSVQAGTSTISFSEIPKELLTDSPFLILKDTKILSQRFVNDVFNSEHYFTEKLGQEVVLKVHDDTEYEGILLAVNHENISLKTKNKIFTISRNYVDYIYSANEQINPQLQPYLVWEIQSTTAKEISGDLVYLTGGFDWEAAYRIILNDEKIQFISEAVISNNCLVNYTNNSVKLVEGNLQKKNARPVRMFKAESVAAADHSVSFPEEEALGDFHIYTLPGRINLDPLQSVTVGLYEPKNVNYEKMYVFANSEQSKKEEPLQIEIKVVNKTENNLGIPLPQGKVRLFLQSADGSLEYAGEDMMRQVAVGENALISAGKAFDVLGKRTILHYDRQRSSEEATIEITVKNVQKKKINVRLEEQIYGDWVIREASENYVKKDANTIHFQLAIKAEDSKTVSYTYRKEWK